jgi:hypothetical protein
MDWKNEYRNKRLLFAIGAGAAVLALIAFSGICWGALGLCGAWTEAFRLDFWEFVALSGTIVVAFVLLRSFRKQPVVDPIQPFATVVDSDDSFELPPLQLDERRQGKSGGWKQLYDQLSRDERELFKAMIAKVSRAEPPADDRDTSDEI